MEQQISQQAPKPEQDQQIRIEKGIPIPRRGGGFGMAPKYPWYQMEVGDSFFAPDMNAKKPSFTAPKRLRDKGWKFLSRKEGDGRCVWRYA